METAAAEAPGLESPAAAAEAERHEVERARAGDPIAFRTLVKRYQDRAYGLALRIVRSPAEAEEVAQDAFVRVWKALAGFRGEAAFSTWLYRIVARRALDRAEQLRTRRGREAELESAGEPAVDPEPRADAESVLRARRLEHLMARLTDVQRAVVTLYYYRDQSVEEVARLLAMPENTVKTHLSRARSALREAWVNEENAG